jgi:hypothetical protein
MFFFRKMMAPPPSLTLEGSLGPNDRLDEADAIPVTAPETICVAGDALLISSGRDLYRLETWGAPLERVQSFEAGSPALTASPEGQVAVALAGGQLQVFGGEAPWSTPQLNGIADLLFLSESELAVVEHGYAEDQPVLSYAPWDSARRGQVLAVHRNGSTRRLSEVLHCPMGIVAADNTLCVSQLDQACIVEVKGALRQQGFPAYLGRVCETRTGYAIACLSRRNPLIEFLKTEKSFVRMMKETIDPRNWIAPRATPEFAHDFPMALGATRLFGEIKPWAPSFSYGLIIETDKNFVPIGSAHCRANGQRHAITDVVEWNGDLIAVSRASGEILNLGAI